ELIDEQVCNALNKVTVEREVRLFAWNDSIRALEGKLAKKTEELAKVARKLKQEELINAQLRCELKEEKENVQEVYKKVDSIKSSIILKHPDLTPIPQ
ncbi:hypothetical protein KI387_044705, partial [Taxus chinensis]